MRVRQARRYIHQSVTVARPAGDILGQLAVLDVDHQDALPHPGGLLGQGGEQVALPLARFAQHVKGYADVLEEERLFALIDAQGKAGCCGIGHETIQRGDAPPASQDRDADGAELSYLILAPTPGSSPRRRRRMAFHASLKVRSRIGA